MKQQTLLLDDVPDRRFLEFPHDVQQAALDLMAALLVHVYTQAEERAHESTSDRR
jgi:hypothetical protein